MSLTLKTNLTSFDRMLDSMTIDVEDGVRPASQAGAEVFYQQVKRNVAGIGRVTGNLDSAIYQAYSANNSGKGRAVYHVSWNARKAPHGHLVEFGHIQRYKVYTGRDGRWYTAIRPGMKGKKAPPRKASQSVKDAYYVPLASPRQVAAQPFIRPALAVSPQAAAAAEKALWAYLRKTWAI
jgi:hypothetical protein